MTHSVSSYQSYFTYNRAFSFVYQEWIIDIEDEDKKTDAFMNDFSVLLSLFESSADSRCTCVTRDLRYAC
jgi:hypothetical protein